MAKKLFDDKQLMILMNDKEIGKTTLSIIEQAGIEEIKVFLRENSTSYKNGFIRLFAKLIKENPILLDIFTPKVMKYVDSTKLNENQMAEIICIFSTSYVANVVYNYANTFDKTRLIEAIVIYINNGIISYNQPFIDFCTDITIKAKKSFERNDIII